MTFSCLVEYDRSRNAESEENTAVNSALTARSSREGPKRSGRTEAGNAIRKPNGSDNVMTAATRHGDTRLVVKHHAKRVTRQTVNTAQKTPHAVLN